MMATGSTRVDVRERRSFSNTDKQRIVREYRAAVASGDGGGVVLRREGIYQSLVHRWGRHLDAGNGARIAAARQTVLDHAHQAHPERFPNGPPRPPKQPARVWINPTELHAQ